MAAVTICSDFQTQKHKMSHCFHCFPIYLNSLAIIKNIYIPNSWVSAKSIHKHIVCFSYFPGIRVGEPVDLNGLVG